MTTRWGSTLVGLGLATATGIALPVLLGANSNGEDLRVKVGTERSYEVLSTPQAGRALVEFQPKDVSTKFLLKEGESGLNLTTWSKTYGGSYVREVTWPTLTGPFHAENDFVCGYSLQLGAGLFDTTGAGVGLQKLVDRELAKIFPLTVGESGITGVLPALESSILRITLADGVASLVLHLLLVDGTTLDVALPVNVVARNGLPSIEPFSKEQLDVRFEGPSRKRLIEQAKSFGGSAGALGGCALGVAGGPIGMAFGCVGGYLFGSDVAGGEAESRISEKAKAIVAAEVDKVLRRITFGLGRLGEPFHPFSERPGDEISLRLDGNPSVDPLGITLPLCVRLEAAKPKADSNIPGPVALSGNRITHQKLASAAPVVGLTLNGDATNQLVYYAWQAGLLKKVGESTLVLAALSEQVRLAAFDFTGFAPGLPPTLAPSLPHRPGLPFVLGNVKIGSLNRKTVVGHSVAVLDLVQEGDSIELQGHLEDMHVNCVSSKAAGTSLSPCLSDLLPVVRDIVASGRQPSHRFSGPKLLEKLPQLAFQGVSVHLSSLRASSTDGSPGISLTAIARIE